MDNPLDRFLPEFEPGWMRPPLWRWRVASEYLANPRLSPTRETDDVIRGAAFFLRSRAGSRDPLPVWRDFPAYHLAHKIWGMASQFGGMRWQVEALMLAGFTDEQLARMLPMHSGRTVFELYRRLFFDIDDYRDNQFAVLANVFATSYARNYDDNDCDLTWKMLAYELREKFPQLLRGIMGGRMPKEISERLSELTKARLQYVQHHFVNSMRLQYNDQALQLLTSAGQFFSLNEAQVGQIHDQRLTSSCDKLLTSVHLVITDARAKLNAVEPLQADVDAEALVQRFCTK